LTLDELLPIPYSLELGKIVRGILQAKIIDLRSRALELLTNEIYAIMIITTNQSLGRPKPREVKNSVSRILPKI